MKNHVTKRTKNMLDGVEEFEQKNTQTIINKIRGIAIKELKKLQEKPTKEVLNASFLASLDGIEKGYMDYEKDIVMEIVSKKVLAEIQKFKKMSKSELEKLIILTKD